MNSIFPINFLLMLFNPSILILLIIDNRVQVSGKRYDKSRIVELPGSSVEMKEAGCEFNCDKDCSLDPNCVASNLWKNGTCKIVWSGGVTLENDPDSVAKTRGIF